MLFLLNASAPRKMDLQRLISYDYLLVYSGDVDTNHGSLHPAVPFRGSEWLVKRDVVRAALDLMFARELVDKKLETTGIYYQASVLTSNFIALLKSKYARSLATRAQWVATRFGDTADSELEKFMTTNVGRWGAEFERHTALRELELE
jgi:hypothetical protein